MSKMEDYEDQLKKERADYRGKIRQLEEEVTTFRSWSDRENKENYQVAELGGHLKGNALEGSKVQNPFQNQRKPLE